MKAFIFKEKYINYIAIVQQPEIIILSDHKKIIYIS